MNIQQFKYILAVAESRHFETAARKSFISQSTLSTMISKFEKEIGIAIFDRKKKPVEVTSEGKILIEQLKIITREIEQLEEVSKAIKGEVSGDLTISVIPTIAPFLLPLFLQDFATQFPNLNIQVREQTTAEIMRQLKSRDLDMGILSIPVLDPDIQEIKLYDEPFLFYGAGQSFEGYKEVEELDVDRLCLLEEGHCMRTQVINLCDTSGFQQTGTLNFEYKAGSIDSLLRFVKANKATTLLPHLATIDLPETDRLYLSPFIDPQPFRSIGIVVHRHFVKNRILEVLKASIIEKVEKVLPVLNMEGTPLRPV